MRFEITGYIVPYVRMTQESKFADKRAGRYLDSKKAIGWQLLEQMSANGWIMLPKQTPLKISLIIWTPELHTKDADNQLKAVFDAANRIVYPDDRWIDKIRLERYKGYDKAIFTVELIGGASE